MSPLLQFILPCLVALAIAGAVIFWMPKGKS